MRSFVNKSDPTADTGMYTSIRGGWYEIDGEEMLMKLSVECYTTNFSLSFDFFSVRLKAETMIPIEVVDMSY